MFGVEKNIDDSDTNAFRYCGEYYDKETATVYLRETITQVSAGLFQGILTMEEMKNH